jgi:hypothetical protein
MKKKTNEISQARELRRNGESVREIAKKLKVSKGSVSTWVRDIELSQEQKEILKKRNPMGRKGKSQYPQIYRSNSRIYLKKRIQWQHDGRKLAKENERLFNAACMLYWGEGAKNANTMMVNNTDPYVVKLMKQFMDIYFSDFPVLFEVKYKPRAKISEQRVQQHWGEVLGIDPDIIKVRISTDKRSSGNLKHPFGIGSIVCHRTQVVQTIFGGIQEIGKFQKKEWLKTEFSKRKALGDVG